MAGLGGTSSASLLFHLKADSSQAVAELKHLKEVVASETEAIKKFGKSNFSALSDSVDSAGKSLFSLKGYSEGASAAISSFVGNLGADAVQSLTSALVSGGKAVLDYSSKLEQTKIGFTALLGSGEKAAALLKEIQDFAKSTPFEFEGIAGLSQRLAGANVEATKIIPLMRDIGNVVAATGETSQDRLEGVTVAITQMISKQKVSSEEMEQLAERGINGFQILSEATGKSQAELRKLAEGGKISADVMLKALQQISQQKYGDAMEKQSQTFSGAMSNIKDAVKIAANSAFTPLYEKISEISVRTAKELESADFGEATHIIAKNIAKGFGEALADELKREINSYSWEKFYKDINVFPNIGAELGKGIFGDFNLTDYISKSLGGITSKDIAEKDRWAIQYGVLGTYFYEKFYGGFIKASSPEKFQKFVGDLTKAVDVNGVKYQFDTVSNTLKQVKDVISSIPNLGKQLDAEKAAEDAEKLNRELAEFQKDYLNQISFFGDESEVATAKQKLLAKGVTDFNSGLAKSIIELAQTVDKLKEAKRAQDEYTQKIKDARKELETFDQKAFDNFIPDQSELDRFNRWVDNSKTNLTELRNEIKFTRDLLKSSLEFQALLDSQKRFTDLSNSIEQTSIDVENSTKKFSPLQEQLLAVAKAANLVETSFVSLDKIGSTVDTLNTTDSTFVAKSEEFLKKYKKERDEGAELLKNLDELFYDKNLGAVEQVGIGDALSKKQIEYKENLDKIIEEYSKFLRTLKTLGKDENGKITEVPLFKQYEIEAFIAQLLNLDKTVNKATLQKGLEKVEEIFEKLNLTIGDFGAKTDLQKLNDQLSDPAITEAIKLRAEALGYTVDQLKEIIRLKAENDANPESKSTRPRVVEKERKGESVFGTVENIFGLSDEVINKVTGKAEVLKTVFADLKGWVIDASKGMLDAFGSAIEGYLLYGDSIAAALKKAAAAELAHIASVAAIKALFYTAEGIVSLFIAPAAAPYYFKAAAMYGLVALAAGVGAKALAGSQDKGAKSFSQQSSTATGQNNSNTGGGNSQNGGNYYTTNRDTRFLEEDRQRTINSQSEPPTQIIQHNINMTDIHGRRSEFVIKEVIDGIKNRTQLKQVLVELIRDN